MAEPQPLPANFINELGLAWKQLWIYPKGHPSRAGAVERAHRALSLLLAPTGSLAVGVDRAALVCEGERVDSPSAQRLAGQLFGRNVAVVTFADGIDAAELERFLDLLNPDPNQLHTARLWDEASAFLLPHVRFQPVDYSGLEITDDLADPGAPAAKAEPPPKQANLWQQILDQLMAGRRVGATDADGRGGEATLADVITSIERLLETATAQGIVGGEAPAPTAIASLGEQIAAAVGRHLDLAGPEALDAELHRIAHLLRALPPELRPPLLDAVMRRLAAADHPGEPFSLLAASTSAAELFGSLRRLSTRGARFSDAALRAIEELVFGDAPPARPVPGTPGEEGALARFLALGDVEGPPPGAGRERILLALPVRTEPPAEPLPELETRRRSLGEAEQERAFAETLLLLALADRDDGRASALAARLEAVFCSLLRAGRLQLAEEIVAAIAAAGLPERDETLRRRAGRLGEQLAGAPAMGALVELLGQADRTELERPQRLVRALGDPAVRELLLLLAEESDMARRRHLFDFLGGLGAALGPHAAAALGDPRWFVVRNMLALLRESGDRTQVEAVRATALHADPRVRLEAVRALATLDRHPPDSLVDRLLSDPDPKVAELATRDLGARSRQGREALVALLRRWDPFGGERARRLQALRALAATGDPEVLPRLRRSFRGGLFGAGIEERRAAYASLAGYPPAARRTWLEKGAKSPDAEIRRTCVRLLASGEEGPS